MRLSISAYVTTEKNLKNEVGKMKRRIFALISAMLTGFAVIRRRVANKCGSKQTLRRWMKGDAGKMQSKPKTFISLLLASVFILGLLPVTTITAFAAGNTIYIVDAGNPNLTTDPTHYFTWTQWATATNATNLQDGDTLDLSGATPDTTGRSLGLAARNNITIKSDPNKVYPISFTASNAVGTNLTFENLNITINSANTMVTMSGTGTNKLTIVGTCNITTLGTGLQINGSLIIEGDTLYVLSVYNPLQMQTTGPQSLTVNADVTLMGSGSASTSYHGISFSGNPFTIGGSGSLTAIGRDGGNGLNTSQNNPVVNINGPAKSLYLSGTGTGHGMYSVSTNVTLNINRPNQTTISGGDTGHGLNILGSSSSNLTINNTGAPVTFLGGGISGTGIYTANNLVLTGSGISAIGGGTGDGVRISTAKLDVSGLTDDFNIAGGNSGYGLYAYSNCTISGGTSGTMINARGGNGREGVAVQPPAGNRATLTLSGNVGLNAIGGAGAKGFYLTFPSANISSMTFTDDEAICNVFNNSDAAETDQCVKTGTGSWSVTGDGYISTGNGAAANVTISVPTGGNAGISLDSTIPAITAPDAGNLPNGTGGTAYSAALTASQPSTWAVVSGILPNGLTLNTSTGEIAGNPMVNGTFDFRVTAAAGGKTSAPLGYRITASVSPAQTVAADKAWLTFDVIKDTNTAENSITANLLLPSTGEYGSTISWASSDTSVITNTGAVTRNETKTVTLTATISSGTVTDTKSFTLTVIYSDEVNLSGAYLTNSTQPNVPHIDIGDEITVVAYGQPGAAVTAEVTYSDVIAATTGNTLSALTLTEDAGTGTYRGTFTVTDGMVITGVKTTMAAAGKNPATFNVPTSNIPETRGSLRVSITNGASAAGLLTAYSANLSAGSSAEANLVAAVTIKGLQAAADYRLSMTASDGFDMGVLPGVPVVAGKISNVTFTAVLPTMLNSRLIDQSTGLPLANESVMIRNAAGQVIASKVSGANGYLPSMNLTALSLAPGQNIEFVYQTYKQVFVIGGASREREYPAQTVITHTLTAGMNNIDLSVSEVVKNATINGTVINQNSERVADATVSIRQIINNRTFNWTAVTDANGEFTVNIAPGVSAEVQFVGVPTYQNALAPNMNVTVGAGGSESITMNVMYYGNVQVTFNLYTQGIGESGWMYHEFFGYDRHDNFNVTISNAESPLPISIRAYSTVTNICGLPGETIKISVDGKDANFGKAETTCVVEEVGGKLVATAELRMKQPGAMIDIRLRDSQGDSLPSLFDYGLYLSYRILEITVYNEQDKPVYFNKYRSSSLSGTTGDVSILVPQAGTYRIESQIIHQLSYNPQFGGGQYGTCYRAVRTVSVAEGEVLYYGVINMTVTGLSPNVTGKINATPSISTPGGTVTLKSDYTAKGGWSATSLTMQVPPGATFLPGSLTLNSRSVQPDPIIGSDGRFTVQIPAGEQVSGFAAFRVKLNNDIAANRIFTSAYANADYLGTAEIQIQTLSLEVPEYTARRDMTLRGKAPVGAEVTVYDRGRPIGTATASSAGTWYINVLLPGEDGIRYLHELKAEAGYNGEKNVTAVQSMWYEPRYPQLTYVTVLMGHGNEYKEIDVSGGSVAYAHSYNPSDSPNIKVGAKFTDNSAVSDVVFWMDCGAGYFASAQGTYNAAKQQFEGVLIDAYMGAEAGASEGFIWVEYEANLNYLEHLLDASPLTEAQFRTTLPSEFSFFNVANITPERQITPEELGLPAGIVSGALTATTMAVDNYPYGVSQEITTYTVPLPNWSAGGRSPLCSGTHYSIYELYYNAVESGDVTTIVSYYVILDHASGNAVGHAFVSTIGDESSPIQTLAASNPGSSGTASVKPLNFDGSFSYASTGFQAYDQPISIMPLAGGTRVKRKNPDTGSSLASSYISEAQSDLSAADTWIERSCAPQEMKDDWTDTVSIAWNAFVDEVLHNSDMSDAALDYDPHAGNAVALLHDIAIARMKQALRVFRRACQNVIDDIISYNNENCEPECPPGYTKVCDYKNYDGEILKFCRCEPYPDPKPGGKPKFIRDPSGIVYEVTMDEPIEGVTATLLYETGSDTGSGTGKWEVWDAEWYEQVNPYITGADGWYAWDVPNGNWQVMYEKDGYRTEFSTEMVVPPIRLDVHQPLESLSPAIPKGTYWTDDPDTIEIVFDKYVKVSDINAGNVSVYTALLTGGVPLGGNEFLQGTFEPVDAVEYKGEWVAKSYTFTLGTGTFDQATTYNASFMPAINSYADIPLGFGADGKNYVLTVTAPPPVPVKGITIDPLRYFLEIGDFVHIDRTVYPANAANPALTWTTSDPSVATVCPGGNITAVAPGVCYITAITSDGGFEAYANVYVSAPTVPPGDIPVSGVRLNVDELNLIVGGAPVQLTATVTPGNASNKAVSWSVCNTSIITVTQTGLVTPVGEGTCVVTVTTAEGNFYADCIVKVTLPGSGGVRVTGVTLDKNELNLTTGGASAKLNATVLPSDAADKRVQWSVCNTSIATVDQNGNVSPVGEGTCVITVTTLDGGFTATCVVSVAKQSGTVDPSRPSVNPPGETVPDSKPPLAWRNPYSDVANTDWFYEAVRFVTEEGLMTGTAADKFSPGLTMTRAMIVTVLYRLEGKPALTGAIPFADVKAGGWYSDAILWASQNDIVLGYGGGKFGPNNPITREQAVVILYRYAKAKGLDISAASDLSKFADADKISDWALDAMKWAVAVGIIEGRPGNRTAPQDTSTRAELAMIFKRYID